MRFLLLENIHPGARDMLAAQGHDVQLLSSALKEDELAARLADVDVLGIRSKTHVTSRVLASARNLISVGCFCIGTNQVDLADANRRGVAVFNAPFSNTRSVAELIIAEIVALARQLCDRSSEVHLGKWKKAAVGCYEVRGKTLGIVGYGHIGSQVGVLAESMGMRVVFFDVATKLPMGNNRPAATLDDLLGESDFVTMHVPATPQTDRMMGEHEIRAMKKGAYLLNASRGTVVVIPALAAALRDGHIAGAAVDVYPEEPETNSDGFNSELRGIPNVILTPHVGGSTTEAQEAIGREVATALLRFVHRGTTAGAVNMPQVELGETRGTHRVLNLHKNVPGVLRDINRIAAERNANIHAQVLSTDAEIGCLIMDLDQDVAGSMVEAMSALPTNLRTRRLS